MSLMNNQNKLQCEEAETVGNPAPIEERMDHLRSHFEQLGFPQSASEWLIMCFDAFQVFDDFADGDKVERPDLDNLIFCSLVAMPSNQFFASYSSRLLPILANAIMKWKASDTVEKNGGADEKSFVWRAGFYDLVLEVANICHGYKFAMENAHVVMALYGEKFKDYKEEFNA